MILFTGYVFDVKENPIENAMVVVEDQGGSGKRRFSDATGKYGQFHIDVPSLLSTATLTVSKTGYVTKETEFEDVPLVAIIKLESFFEE